MNDKTFHWRGGQFTLRFESENFVKKQPPFTFSFSTHVNEPQSDL